MLLNFVRVQHWLELKNNMCLFCVVLCWKVECQKLKVNNSLLVSREAKSERAWQWFSCCIDADADNEYGLKPFRQSPQFRQYPQYPQFRQFRQQSLSDNNWKTALFSVIIVRWQRMANTFTHLLLAKRNGTFQGMARQRIEREREREEQIKN